MKWDDKIIWGVTIGLGLVFTLALVAAIVAMVP